MNLDFQVFFWRRVALHHTFALVLHVSRHLPFNISLSWPLTSQDAPPQQKTSKCLVILANQMNQIRHQISCHILENHYLRRAAPSFMKKSWAPFSSTFSLCSALLCFLSSVLWAGGQLGLSIFWGGGGRVVTFVELHQD